MARMILIAIGSSGDVHPILGIAEELAHRSHEVIVLTNPSSNHSLNDSVLISGHLERALSLMRWPTTPMSGIRFAALDFWPAGRCCIPCGLSTNYSRNSTCPEKLSSQHH